MTLRRSERLVDITAYICQRPFQKIPYSYFVDRYQIAKSTLSEDVTQLKTSFDQKQLGSIETIVGLHGGLVFKPGLGQDFEEEVKAQLIDTIQNSKRILPGGYLYLSDILGQPQILDKIAAVVASRVQDQSIDYVMTVATKGISLATAVALRLNCPMVYARKESKVTEGPAVSVKYTSASAPHRVQTMELGQTSLEKGSSVLLVDDFFRGGGTLEGMVSLLEIFDCQPVACFVLCEHVQEGLPNHPLTQSFVKVKNLDYNKQALVVSAGSVFK